MDLTIGTLNTLLSQLDLGLPLRVGIGLVVGGGCIGSLLTMISLKSQSGLDTSEALNGLTLRDSMRYFSLRIPISSLRTDVSRVVVDVVTKEGRRRRFFWNAPANSK